MSGAGPMCVHWWPRLRGRCDAGHRAPTDCQACAAYYDGSAFLGVSPTDIERQKTWDEARRPPPRAVFRGQVCE